MKKDWTIIESGLVGTFIIVAAFVFFLASCTRKLAFNTSQVVPAAEGSVKVKKDKNNNYNIFLCPNYLHNTKIL